MSTHTFAILHERDGKQLLVTTEVDKEDAPAVQFRGTSKSGHTIKLLYSFAEGTEDRDAAFLSAREADYAWEVFNAAPGVGM